MNISSIAQTVARAILLCLFIATSSATADDKFDQLFNGEDLSGWAGVEGFWNVKGGVIVGQTTKGNPTKGNTFLVWQGGDVLLESIIEPSKVISDQYSSKIVLLDDGRQMTGLVIREKDKVEIYPVQKTVQELKPVVVDADEIEEMKDSSVSQMPAAMLDSLNEDELRDLIAYLLSGGSPKAKVYQKR